MNDSVNPRTIVLLVLGALLCAVAYVEVDELAREQERATRLLDVRNGG